ncbi:hypothetical protein CUR178_07800 [Leishmania enriettii]|uniref:Axonemal dynein light chain n=1 Tax=Leishmania enriettii TaxID=5663 RepID=A0A836H0A1_LEIEN|nr:hypothetical protein CUR178_07800 [Leishmania enriettii]
MPQQLPVLKQEQQAPSSRSPSSFLASSSAGNDKRISCGTRRRTSVSASSIASTQRALLPLRAGRAVVVPSIRQQQHGSNDAAPRQSRKAVPTSGMLVPMLTASTAATNSAPTPLGTSPTRSNAAATAVVPSLHLEHVGFGPSLARESYLPQAQGPNVDDSPSSGADVVVLRDATAGLLTRHLALDSPHDVTEGMSDGGNGGAVVSHSVSDIGDPISPVASSPMVNTTPVASAALLETGVDDRISPARLEKLIRRSRRPACYTATATGKRGCSRRGPLRDGPVKFAFLSPTATSQWQDAGTAAVDVNNAITELRYHELPAITAASAVCYTAASGKVGADGHATSTELKQPGPAAPAVVGANQLSDLIAEYSKDLDTEEPAGKLLQAAAPAMPSAAHAHLAAAVNASDGALVRQLVGYYCARTEATSSARTSAAVVRAPTRANIRSRTTRRSEKDRVGRGASGGDADEGGVASPAFPFASATPAFSLLDAVMCVSREFVAQRSAAGVHGQGTGALSKRRRCLLERLTSLDQVRIPETWWITSPACLGRLAPATGTGSGTAASTGATAENTRDVSPATATVFAATVTENHAGVTRLSSENPTVYSTETAAPPPIESWASEQAAVIGSEVGTVVKDAKQRTSMMGTGLLYITEALGAGTGSKAMLGAGCSHNTIFPAPRPVERSQVYILAEVLDRMLRDPDHPRWLALLADPQVARYVLADGDDEEGDDDQLRGSGHGTLHADLWGTPGEQRLLAYTDAATHVLDILDTGLAELVRQVASHCVERGALLDLLRQSVMDIASAHVHLLGQVKQQACTEALTALTLRKEKARLQQEMEATQKELMELQKSHSVLCTRVEPLKRKSDRLDELMARVAARTRRFETFRHDEHAMLLQLLMESMENSAGAALDSFFTEVHDLQVRHSGLREGATADLNGVTGTAAGASSGDGTASLRVTAVEIPSVAVARSQALEQRRTMEGLYTESYRLLSGLQELVTATNTLCGRLYDNMILKDVSPAAKVATSRWTSVARAVGAFERDKRHRQRVYEVFMEYCTSYRHKRDVDAGLEDGEKGCRTSSNTSSGGRRGYSYGEAFLVNESEAMERPGGGGADPLLEHSASSTILTLKEETDPGEQRQWGKNSAAKGGEGVDIDRAASAAAGAREQMQQEVAKAGTIITREDLEAMGATDCTVDEVNALFRRDFDVQKYLRGSWQQYLLQRQRQEQQCTVAVTSTTSGHSVKHATMGSTYALRLTDVLQMLSDVRTTLAEAVLRMNSIAKSTVLQTSMQSPLEPPLHPEQPCPLCNRRDTCELERHRRREAMSRIARDLQGKMDAAETKARAALIERDKALGEVRRLQMELQHAATAVTAAPARGSTAAGAPKKPHQQQSEEMQPASFQGHRQQRQKSLSQQSATDSTVTVPFIHHAPPQGLVKMSNSLISNSAMTGETGRSENSVEFSTRLFSTSDQLAGFSPTVSGMSSGVLLSPQQSRIIFFGGSSYASASCEDNNRVPDLSIPAQRRSTAVMSVKAFQSAAEEGLPMSHPISSGNSSRSTEGEEAQLLQPWLPSDSASSGARADEMSDNTARGWPQ